MSAIRDIYYPWTMEVENDHYNNMKAWAMEVGWLTQDPNWDQISYRVDTLHRYFNISKRLQAFINQKNCGWHLTPDQFATAPFIPFHFRLFS